MSDAIIVALITAGVSLLLHFLGNAVQQKDLHNKLDTQSRESDARIEQKLAVFTAVTDTKLESLTDEVRRHNEFAVRLPVIEEKVDALDKRVSALEHQ